MKRRQITVDTRQKTGRLPFLEMLLLLVLASGCATSLEKGHRLMKKENYKKARKYYVRAMNKEKKQCSMPEWSGSRYVYRLNAQYAADAILGIANTYRAEQQPDKALYHYFHYVQFCLRHDLKCDNEIEDIRSYVTENRKGDEDVRFENLIKRE